MRYSQTMLLQQSSVHQVVTGTLQVLKHCNSNVSSVFIYKCTCINKNGPKYVKPVPVAARSEATRLLRFRVRVPPGVWMSVFC